jgi:hypothetical protein
MITEKRKVLLSFKKVNSIYNVNLSELIGQYKANL